MNIPLSIFFYPSKACCYHQLIPKGYYSASILTLPRAVKFKRRNTSPSAYVPPIVKKGRTYQDFLCFTEDNPKIPITELDTVIGTMGLPANVVRVIERFFI